MTIILSVTLIIHLNYIHVCCVQVMLSALIRTLRFGLEQEPALTDALAYFVESAAGKWPERECPPLQYHKKRRYIRRTAAFMCFKNDLDGFRSHRQV